MAHRVKRLTKTEKKNLSRAILQKATKLFTDGFMTVKDYNAIRVISIKYQQKLKN